MITSTDRREGAEWSGGGGDLQSTEQHQSLSRGSNGGVYQDDIYRESDERRQREPEAEAAFVKFDRKGGIDEEASQLDQCRKQKWANQGSLIPLCTIDWRKVGRGRFFLMHCTAWAMGED